MATPFKIIIKVNLIFFGFNFLLFLAMAINMFLRAYFDLVDYSVSDVLIVVTKWPFP